MKRVNPEGLAQTLVEAVNKFASNQAKFFVVSRAHNQLLKCCGGKLCDDCRLTYRDLVEAAEKNKGIEQAAKAFTQAMAHEFTSLQGELTKPKPPEPAKAEPKKSDGKQ